jgi:site-specific recombinase XerD
MTVPTSQEKQSRFHTTEAKYREYSNSSLKRAVDSTMITQDDADLILEFVQETKAINKKITDARCFKLTVTLIHLREFFPQPFRESTIKDVYAAREGLEIAQKPDGSTRYKANTIADFVRFMKRFFLWMTENEYSTIPEKKLSNISPPAYRYDTKTAEMIFTKEEIHAMLKACQNSRDRAIISVLYDGALRVGELGTLRWNQVVFTDVDATVTVRFKTEKTRLVPLFMAREYLAAWRNDYPGEPAGDNFVFLTSGGGRNRTGRNQLQYAGVSKQIKQIAERAGITKKITPHLFRHSKITHLIQDGAQESMIKLLGWGHTSTVMMDKCYSHLGPSDVKIEMARLAHVQIEEKPRSKVLEPRQCPRCGTIAGPTHQWCPVCGLELTPEAREKVKVATEQAELLPEFTAMKKQIEDLQKQIISMQAKGSA